MTRTFAVKRGKKPKDTGCRCDLWISMETVPDQPVLFERSIIESLCNRRTTTLVAIALPSRPTVRACTGGNLLHRPKIVGSTQRTRHVTLQSKDQTGIVSHGGGQVVISR